MCENVTLRDMKNEHLNNTGCSSHPGWGGRGKVTTLIKFLILSLLTPLNLTIV